MKPIDKTTIKNILYRCPLSNINKIKNLNIYNKPPNNELYNSLAKYYVLKPKGRKSYVWFTYYKKNLLALLIIMNNKDIADSSNEFYDLEVEFDNTLCYNNVLLYGYYFKYNHKSQIANYFVIENIYNFNNYNSLLFSNNYNLCFSNKISLFNHIMPKITNKNNNNIKIPIIVDNIDSVYKVINNLNYNVYCINSYSKNNYLGQYIFNNKKINYFATFKITPCINNDIYNLYITNYNKEEYYSIALIDSYKTSKFMNNLFRNIKENKNLDLLEESDDDDEFEDTSEGKFVNLTKSYNIECEYNLKFKKWIPRKLSNNNVINKNDLHKLITKKNITNYFNYK